MIIITKKLNSGKSAIDEAVEILKNSGVVAFPTETVYGIGCDYSDEAALKKIYEVKGRSFTKPLAAHISKLDEVKILAEKIPDEFYKLAENFLPGPLSIVLNKRNSVSDIMTAGLDTVAIRFPANKTALDLISTFGKPLAATSANISGNKAPITAEDVSADLTGKIPLIIDEGKTSEKMESTVISLVNQPKLIRQGAVPVEEIENILGSKLLLNT